jgi:hypothetical protein
MLMDTNNAVVHSNTDAMANDTIYYSVCVFCSSLLVHTKGVSGLDAKLTCGWRMCHPSSRPVPTRVANWAGPGTSRLGRDIPVSRSDIIHGTVHL